MPRTNWKFFSDELDRRHREQALQRRYWSWMRLLIRQCTNDLLNEMLRAGL